MPGKLFPFSTALVTGASSGIGRELARRLARGGTRVAITARRKAELESLAGEIAHAGGEAVALPADLSQPAEAFRIVEQAEKELGAIDLVVANAGVGGSAFLIELPWEDIQQTLMVNTIGAMALIRAALPAMVRRRSGYIAGISSLASYRGLPTNSHYSSSKAALSTFLESARVEVRNHGVAVIDIHPGYILTPMTASRKGRMRFAMDVERATGLILNAIVRKRAVYNFPWQMALLLRIARMMPPPIYDRLMSFRHVR